MIKPKLASAVISGFIVVAVLLALAATFWEQDLISSMIGISSGFTMYYLHRNPELLMARSRDELNELYEASRDKKYLWGFPAYQLLMASAALYIWLV